MANIPCMCLGCGRRVTMDVASESEINERSCPSCGGMNMIRENPDEFFRRIFGLMGGGGG